MLLAVDLLFLAANLTKLAHGAWLPLLVGVVAFTIMTTWQRGREIVTDSRVRIEGQLQDFVDDLACRRPAVQRVAGTAVFLNRGDDTTPLAMRANIAHNHVLHEHTIILALTTEPVPRVSDGQRISIDDLGSRDDGILHATARFGYMERPDVPAALRLLDPSKTDGLIDVDGASFFLSKLHLTAGRSPTMAQWRKRLFIATSHMTADAAGFFNLPLDNTVIVGSRLEV